MAAFNAEQNNSEHMAHNKAPIIQTTEWQPEKWVISWENQVPVPHRSVLDEHIFQINSSYCNLYWDSCKVLLPDEAKPSHGVMRYVISSNVNSYFGATFVAES